MVWCSQKFCEIKFLLRRMSVFGLNCPKLQNSLLSKFKIQSKILNFDTCNIILLARAKGNLSTWAGQKLCMIQITLISVYFVYITFTISGKEHFLYRKRF